MLLPLILAQIAIPAPTAYVNDFAGVLDAAAVRRMEAVITDVRDKTRGEIAVVTLADIGDPAKNLGVVVLLVPRKNHRPGTGKIFIATGRGAEGFLTDARVGRIRDMMNRYFAAEDYSGGLEEGVGLLAQAFADQFGVTISTSAARPPPPPPAARGVGIPGRLLFWLVVILILFVLRAIQARQRHEGWGWLFTSGGGWGGGGGGGGFSGGFG